MSLPIGLKKPLPSRAKYNCHDRTRFVGLFRPHPPPHKRTRNPGKKEKKKKLESPAEKKKTKKKAPKPGKTARRKEPNLDSRYGEIGISAVAAALPYQSE